MRYRRKALIILAYEFDDRPLANVEKIHNQRVGQSPHHKDNLILSTTSLEFLISRDKETKRPGFIEVELESGETPTDGLRRVNPTSLWATRKRWVQIESFSYEENNNQWKILVGVIGVHPDQRGVDLYTQSDELPFLLEWHTPGWLNLQAKTNLLNLLTSEALKQPAVQKFLRGSQKKEPA